MSLSSIAGPHRRRLAMTAILTHLNETRAAVLAAAQAAYLAEHGVPAAFPPAGPVLPQCVMDDPRDIGFNPAPNARPDILRRLSLMSGTGRPGQLLDANADEPTHQLDLEWMIIVPAEYNNEDGIEFGTNILDRGIWEIEFILAPLRQSGLTASPDVADVSQAISFDFASIDFQSFDIGDHVAHAAYISLDLTLDAVSVLS